MSRNGQTYAEKLRRPEWQRKRLEILERDGFKCTECGDDKSELHVHHAVYAKGRDPWDYADSLLRSLCKSCHERHEFQRDSLLVVLSDASIYQMSVVRSLARCVLRALPCEIDGFHAIEFSDDLKSQVNAAIVAIIQKYDADLLRRIEESRDLPRNGGDL